MRPDRPLLTIAIPTYNRCEYLAQLLELLLPQLANEPAVELLISDNASTDDTPALMANVKQARDSIRYLRNENNIGADANFLQCYEESSGKYLWLFGDDDLILNGGVSAAVALLKREQPDFMFLAPYIFEHSSSEIVIKKRSVPTTVTTDASKLVFLANLHADLIFISSGVVNKDRLASVDHPPFSLLVNTSLLQLGWIFTSLRHLRKGIFVQRGILGARAGNSRGGLRAAQVFGTNYARAVETMLNPESRLAKKILNDHLKMWFPLNWDNFRERDRDSRARQANEMKILHGNKWFWICAYPLIAFPDPIARVWSGLLRSMGRIWRVSLSMQRQKIAYRLRDEQT